MKRRDFIKLSVVASIALFTTPKKLNAAEYPTTFDKMFANIILDGGLDMRMLLTPVYDSNPDSFGYIYWSNRLSIFNINSISQVQDIYNEYYETIEYDGVEFGLLKSALWLKEAFAKKQVAIINNVGVQSNTRNHPGNISYLESGKIKSYPNGSGWGGKLAKELNTNIASLSPHVRSFCHYPTNDDSIIEHLNKSVISMVDTRNLGIYQYDGSETNVHSSQILLSRLIHSYFRAKHQTLDDSSPYKKITSTFHKSIENAKPMQEALKNISRDERFNSAGYIGKQLGNLYDTIITQNVLNTKIASLELIGCDTHKKQIDIIESFEDMFGDGSVNRDGGFKVLFELLEQNMPNAIDNLAVVLMGEFGRQLKSNGLGGTEHGAGTTALIIGGAIEGGVYGDMFPESEKVKYSQLNSDIEILTDINNVFGKVCEWMDIRPERVLENYSSLRLESNLELDKLFKA
jgi:uncharacterized protein (DUF1501 family)